MEVRKGEWLAAMRWRRVVEAIVSKRGLTFTQWLVLEAVDELTAELECDPIQNEIAARVELDRTTVSQVVSTLERKDLVLREDEALGRAWLVGTLPLATDLLCELRPRIEAASSSASLGERRSMKPRTDFYLALDRRIEGKTSRARRQMKMRR